MPYFGLDAEYEHGIINNAERYTNGQIHIVVRSISPATPPPLRWSLLTFVGFVHVAGFAADIRLVNFDFARELAAFVVVLHSQPDAMEHKPRLLLVTPTSGSWR